MDCRSKADVGDVVGEVIVVDDGCDGVAAADEGERAGDGGYRHTEGHGVGAVLEVRELVHADGAVPQDRLGGLDDGGELLDGAGTDVHAFPAFGDVVVRGDVLVGVVVELVGADVVDGEVDVHALQVCLVDDLLGHGNHILFEEGVADFDAHRVEESVAHSTCNNQIVNLFQKEGDDVQQVK